MTNALIRKLQAYSMIDAADIASIEAVCAARRTVPAGTDLIRDGDKPMFVLVMLEGWGYRYKLLADGSRQITDFLLPGDFCDVNVPILDRMDHSIGTLTRATIAAVPRPAMARLAEGRPGITHAFAWSRLVDEAILRAWIVNLGSHDATQRVAHLLSELWQRAIGVGLVADNLLRLPLTQTDIGDALGLTNIHVSRVLQDLRSDGLIWQGPQRAFAVLDAAGLADRGGFQPSYLHRMRDEPAAIRATDSAMA